MQNLGGIFWVTVSGEGTEMEQVETVDIQPMRGKNLKLHLNI